MDDRRLCGAMVDRPPPETSGADEKPFVLRSTLLAIAFLVVLLGVIPSLFYLAGEWPTTSLSARTIFAQFWRQLCALVGLFIFSVGLASYVFCSGWLIFFGRGPHVEFDPPKAFVATGPYRWVRNPVVISLLVTWAGQAVYFASIGLAVLVGLGMACGHYQATRIEEPRLRLRFGQTYEDYCKKVPRWLPRPPRD
jgi:protein-S-isoprenylcysteine O-methyltransferase Ste14